MNEPDGLSEFDHQGNALTPAALGERERVKKWLKEIKDARDFDEEARKRMARDRAYVRGDSPFEVRVNLIKSYITILVSFIYARDPTIDVMPEESVGPERIEQARQIAKALEIVTARKWRKARMKAHAKRWVRSTLTIGIGWLKAAWDDGMGLTPATQETISSLQENLRGIEAKRRELADGDSAADLDALRLELEEQIRGAEANVERVRAQGMVLDMIPGEDITVSLNVPSVLEYHGADWMAHRFFRTVDKAATEFPEVPRAELKKLCSYSRRKTESVTDENSKALPTSEVSATDADQYIKGGAPGSSGQGEYICFHEVWDQTTNQFFTVAEGYDRYVRPPTPAPISERFYPFFGLSFTEIDGERHPISLTTDSMRLQDEYQRMRSNKKEWRRRTKPKTIFNKRELGTNDAKRMTAGGTQEMVGVSPTSGMKADLRKLVVPLTYAQFDPMLFDTAEIRAELEMLWGIQEALASSIQVAKTATEAEIQQSGTNARTGAMRDAMEAALTELAEYSAELEIAHLSMAEAQEIAGPEVFWPQTNDPSLLSLLVSVEIRAGSSGKPNTTQQRESWAATMPHLEKLIQQIAVLRRSDPMEVASKLEALAIETMDRMGERFDPARFIPIAGQPIPLVDPQTGQVVLAHPAAMPGGGAPGGPAAAGGPPMPSPQQDPGQKVAPSQLPENIAPVETPEPV